MKAAASRQHIARTEIDALGPWFHNLHLPDGQETAPDHWLGDFPTFKWEQIAPSIPADLSGWTILDIGCNAGFYSIELAKRGGEVLGIDVNADYLRQAEWAVDVYGLEDRITLRQMQVYELARHEEKFDLVWFMGVFYHLRYPLLGLDIVAQKTKRLLVFQTLTSPEDGERTQTEGLDIDERDALAGPGWPKLAFLEHGLAGDPTNWWAVNPSGVDALLRTSGMRIIDRPGHEIYICEPDPDNPSCVSSWNAEELLAATGRI